MSAIRSSSPEIVCYCSMNTEEKYEISNTDEKIVEHGVLRQNVQHWLFSQRHEWGLPLLEYHAVDPETSKHLRNGGTYLRANCSCTALKMDTASSSDISVYTWNGKGFSVHSILVCMGGQGKFHLFLNSVIDGDEWSTSRSGRFTSGKRTPITTEL